MRVKNTVILVLVVGLAFSLNGCLGGIREIEHDENYSNSYESGNIFVRYSDNVNKGIVKDQAVFLVNLGVENHTELKIHQNLDDVYKVKIIDYENTIEGIEDLSVGFEGLALMFKNQVYEGESIELFLCDEDGNVEKEFKVS